MQFSKTCLYCFPVVILQTQYVCTVELKKSIEWHNICYAINPSSGLPLHSEFVGGESWPIQCCAQNVETGFIADVQK